ncbi:MAG: hypothetical protein J1F32_02405 [Erysipelotrichales bacterium]|nr:hypothetical protein [Erysipelotrichales bacterium]
MLGRQRAYGFINAAFFLFGFLLCGAIYVISIIEESSDIEFKWFLLVAIIFLVLFIINIVCVIKAPTSKGHQVMLLIFGIIFSPLGGMFGLFNIVSYVYAKKYMDDEYIPSMHERRKERRADRRERRRERIERLKSDGNYRAFVVYLFMRKIVRIIYNVILLALTFFHSIFIVMAIPASPILAIIIYVVSAMIAVFLKGYSVGSIDAYDYTEVTEHYRWEDSDSFFVPSGYQKVGETRKDKTDYKFQFSGEAALYILFGWIMFFPQIIGTVLAILVKSKSEHLAFCRSSKQIPEDCLAVSPRAARRLAFLFGFVPVTSEYLDYQEYKLLKRRKRL